MKLMDHVDSDTNCMLSNSDNLAVIVALSGITDGEFHE